MEGLPFHLSHSQFFILVPACYLRFLFLLFTILLSCLASSSLACELPFKCGDLTFEYPFGKKGSGCGDPALQIDCEDDMPFLNISGHQYRVLSLSSISVYSKIITIIDKNLLGRDRCNPLPSNDTVQTLLSPQFHIEDGYKNITLWGDCDATYTDLPDAAAPLRCNHSWHYNLTSDLSSLDSCKSQIVLPLVRADQISNGLGIKWELSQKCKDCGSSHGFCGYNDSMPFYCDCSGIVYADKCRTHKSKTPVIIGCSIGGVGLVAAVVLFLIYYVRRRKVAPTQGLGSDFSTEPQLSNVEKFLQNYAHQMPSRYSYPQLKKITNNFAHKVGEGGFGMVYKGKLPSGNPVAVKMLDRSRHSENQFMNEVATIGRIHHVNLVRLMGYCYEGIISALMYEYMANGSLEKFIFAEREVLNWEQLCSIALGAARGIAYLHDDCSRRIIHFDIKPHNILLDSDFTPKVADFGLAKLCGKKDDHISMTAARGTPGYVAPELGSRNMGPVTEKSDVYSFGMVLLEMVGGRKNIDIQLSRSSQFYFPEWAFKLLEKGELETRVRGRGKAEIECEDKEKARRLAKVGLWCIQYNSTDRPCMNRVVQMLEGNGEDVTHPPIPFKSSIRAAPSIHSSEESSS